MCRQKTTHLLHLLLGPADRQIMWKPGSLMYVTGVRMRTILHTSSFLFFMSALTFEFKFTVFVPLINVLSSRIHIMKQLLDQLKGHSHRSWMPGVLSTLAFVIAAFGGDSVKERIHSDSSTSPLSAHHSYQFRRGYKRRCVFVSRSGQSWRDVIFICQ